MGITRESIHAEATKNRPPLHLILPHESPAEFERIRSLWLGEFDPDNPSEHELVARLVEADWRTHRSLRQLNNLEERIMLRSDNPLDWTPEENRAHARAERHHAATTRQFEMIRRQITDVRQARIQWICGIAKFRETVAKHPALLRLQPELTPTSEGETTEVVAPKTSIRKGKSK